MRALIDKFTHTIMCPSCQNKDFKVVYKSVDREENFIYHAVCSSCGQIFIFIKDKNGKLIMQPAYANIIYPLPNKEMRKVT